MAYTVGTAWIRIAPSLKGFQSQLAAGTTLAATQVGDDAGKRMGASMSSRLASAAKVGGALLGGAAVLGAASFAKKSVTLEAEFSKTMNLLQATTGIPAKGMERLSNLAMKMGADTVFSASDASKAMLELARGGMTAATIQGGALQGTLTLAAAGELEMGEAANVAVKAMGAFNLRGKDMGGVAAALAGAANASSASVRDMSIALSQSGLAANAVGFSMQETTGILAAFSNAGLEGSDAGTSLKVMLDRLQPSTSTQSKAFRELNLLTAEGTSKFVKANGEFKSAAQIAEILRQSTEGLTQSESKRLITQAFGMDAQRAATILADEGAAGIRKMVKATSDQNAAQRVAGAAMKGTAGAMEQLQGSVETVTLKFGRFISPAVQAGLRGLTNMVNQLPKAFGAIKSALSGGGAGGALSGFGSIITKIGRDIGAVVGPAFRDIGRLITTQFLPAFRDMLPIIAPVAKFLLQMFGDALVGLIKGVVQAIKGFINVISGVFKLVVALVRGDWSKAWDAVKQIVSGAIDFVVGAVKAWFNFGIFALFKQGIKKLLGSWKGLWNGLRSNATAVTASIRTTVMGWLSAVGKLFTSAVKAYLGFWKGLFKTLTSIAVNGWRVLRSAFGGFFAAIRTMVTQAIRAYVDFWKRMFQTFRSLASAGWRALRSLFSGAFNVVKNLFTGAIRGYTGFWSGLFRTLRSTATSVWRSITGVFRDAFRNIRGAFRTAVQAVGNIWSGLQRAAARPVNFVIDTVYNNGIRKVINALPGVSNLPRLSRIGTGSYGSGAIGGGRGPIRAYAGGGVLPGWTPGRDVHRFVSPTGGTLELSGGEAIMRPEFTAAVGGPAGVAALNKAARRRRKFAEGGVLDDLGDLIKSAASGAWNTAKGLAGSVRDWAGSLRDQFGPWGRMMGQALRSVVGDVRSWVSDKITSMFRADGGGQSTPNGLGGLGPAALRAAQFVRQAFGFNGTIGGYAYRTIAGTSQLSKHALGKAIDVMTYSNMALGNRIANYFASPEGRTRFGVENVIWNRRITNAGRGWRWGYYSGVSPHTDHPHIDFYDNGGMLPKGLSLAYNGTGAAEHAGILTNQQWSDLHKVANGARASGPTVNYEHVHVTDLDALMRHQRRESHKARVLAGLPA